MNYICRVIDYMAWFWFMEWLILGYIINRYHRYLTRSLRSLVRCRCEHSKINSISPRDHLLFSIELTESSENSRKNALLAGLLPPLGQLIFFEGGFRQAKCHVVAQTQGYHLVCIWGSLIKVRGGGGVWG